jgi:hypothetical protein
VTLGAARTASEALHARVRAFAAGNAADSFEALALAIAEYQARHSPAFARLVERHGGTLGTVDTIPAVPSDAFRLTRVAVHPEAGDVVRFVTSGTTEAQRGTHPFRTTATYADLAVRFGRAALVPEGSAPRVVALAAPPTDPPSSSLTFMMALFMERFEPERVEPDRGPRWLLGRAGPDVPALREQAQFAARQGRPLLVLATSLALLALVRALDGAGLELPARSVVMQTGGYKGRDVQVSGAELRREVARAFAIDEAAVVSEYGMTELTSQLYEGTCPGAALAGPPELYLAPPWLRVTAVDPVSLLPVPAGEVGLARFVDLGNVDSAVAVVTRDRIRVRGPGIELFGRDPGAPPRGCSLSVEALLSGEPDALGRR